MKRKRFAEFFRAHGLLIAGILLALLFVYSDVVLGTYQVSFTNIMYEMPPWSSEGVKTDGPLLSDVADSFLPAMYGSMKNGSIFRLWDSLTALGAPTDVSIGLYPLNYIFLLPLGAAMLLRTASEFLIAFLGMYLLLRVFDCKKSAAFAAGAAYCFSSVMVMWLGWQHSDVAAFAPLAFFFFERFLQTLKIKYGFGLTASVYLMLVAGMPTYAGYFLYLLAAYVLFHTIGVYRKAYKKIAVVFGGTLGFTILGVLCSMPYTISLLAQVGGNGYMQSRGRQAEAMLPWRYLHSLFFPYLRPENNTAHLNESTIYVGLAALVLLFFTALFFWRKKRMIFWCAALAAVTLLIFTPWLNFIFTRLPAINTSLKYRVITLFNFSLAVLLGLNLNDLLCYREDYIRHKWRTLAALIAGIALPLGIYFYTRQLYMGESGKDITEMFRNYLLILILLGVLLLALLFRKIPTKLIAAGICLVVVFDSGSFAKAYLPLVEKEAPAEPEATDTIRWLQTHITDERFAATGPWTLFPNTNVLYGLDDVRAHNFVLTNADMSSYYRQIAEETSSTPTRYILNGAVNPTLLQYLGVAYLVEENPFNGAYQVPGALSAQTPLRQTVTFEENEPEGILVLAATYGDRLQQEETLLLKITDNLTGAAVYETACSLDAAADNQSFYIPLTDNHLKKDVPYTLEFSANVAAKHAVTLWMNTEYDPEKKAYYADAPVDMRLEMRIVYDGKSHFGTDGLFTSKLEDYAQRAELADTICVLKDKAAVLRRMSREFESHTAFFNREEAFPDIDGIGALTVSDTADITARTDNRVTVAVSVKTPKLLMLNEYYDDNWKVYIDGEVQPMYKSNYLFRAVKVPAGSCTVEFRYEPRLIYTMYYVAGAGVLLLILLVIFRKKIQKYIQIKIQGEEE